jgi:hypothetical protein
MEYKYPCMQANSAPDLFTPRNITVFPLASTILFPDTCSAAELASNTQKVNVTRRNNILLQFIQTYYIKRGSLYYHVVALQVLVARGFKYGGWCHSMSSKKRVVVISHKQRIGVGVLHAVGD